MTIFNVIFWLIALIALITGAYVALRPIEVIEMQKKFYLFINWRIEPVSLPREIISTRLMGVFLVIVTFAAGIYYCFQ